MRYKKLSSHSVGWSTYHIEWCTKYRYKIFKQEKIKTVCIALLNEVAQKNKIKIVEIDVQPEHLHMIASIPATMSISKALNLLKGFCSRRIFQQFPKLKLRYPKGHLWTKGKFMGAVGHVTLEVAKDYVKNQTAHHAKFRKRCSLGYVYC